MTGPFRPWVNNQPPPEYRSEQREVVDDQGQIQDMPMPEPLSLSHEARSKDPGVLERWNHDPNARRLRQQREYGGLPAQPADLPVRNVKPYRGLK